MISKIINANYYNSIPNISTPWVERVSSYTLHWVVSGELNFTIDSKKITLRAGEVIIVKPNVTVIADYDKNEKIIFGVTFFEGDFSHTKNIPFEKPITLSQTLKETFIHYFYTASQYFQKEEVLNDSAIYGYLTSTISSILYKVDILNSNNKKLIFSDVSKINTMVNDQSLTFEIKNYLSKRISENVTLKELSNALGVSVNTAMHVFKKNVGISIMDYFTKIKIEQAMKMIAVGDYSFRTISERLGFESPEYFSRVFKRKTGLTPTEYAKEQSKWSGCLATLFM